MPTRDLRRSSAESLEQPCLLTTIDLATLTAAQGKTIFGADADDQSGRSVSSAGDVNGDGFDDLLIGTANTATGTITNDDTAGFTLSKTAATVPEDGTSVVDSFTVVLTSEPKPCAQVFAVWTRC